MFPYKRFIGKTHLQIYILYLFHLKKYHVPSRLLELLKIDWHLGDLFERLLYVLNVKLVFYIYTIHSSRMNGLLGRPQAKNWSLLFTT